MCVQQLVKFCEGNSLFVVQKGCRFVCGRCGGRIVERTGASCVQAFIGVVICIAVGLFSLHHECVGIRS